MKNKTYTAYISELGCFHTVKLVKEKKKPLKQPKKKKASSKTHKCSNCCGTGILDKDYTIFSCLWCDGKGVFVE